MAVVVAVVVVMVIASMPNGYDGGHDGVNSYREALHWPLGAIHGVTESGT